MLNGQIGPRRTIKQWREARYMDRQEFADFLDLKSVFTLRAWEQGRNKPRLPQQREIAEKLGIHPDQIIWPAESDPKNNLAA